MTMKKFALLVGVEEYRDQMISRLQFARADATALAERLRDRCGFDQVRVLADGSGGDAPDLVNIVTALRDTAGELRQEDLFLFFFAGHGVERDGHGYLLAHDSIHAFPEHCSLSLDLLRKTFGNLAAGKRVLLLDACRNNPQAGRADSPNRMGEMISRDIMAAAGSNPNGASTTTLLTACCSGQTAYEWPAKKHGVFTHYLLEGLNGAAWAGDELDFDSLARYTSSQVRQWSANTPGIQNPQEPWYEKFGAPEAILLSKSQPRATTEAAPSASTAKSIEEDPDSPNTSAQDSCVETRLRDGIDFDIAECQRLLLRGKGLRPHIAQLADRRLGDWRKAAELGWPEGQWLFGRCLDEGLGVEKDVAQAVRWYRKAAEQGDALAQCFLGACYDNGRGVTQDKAEAVRWYRKTAEQGYALARHNLVVYYENGKGVTQEKANVVHGYPLSAEMGRVRAQNILGVHYENGEGVTQDKAEAVRWFRKAAEQRDAMA